MSNTKAIISAAVAGVIGATALISAGAAQAAPEAEKCYGVVKAGKNDCQTSTNACAGHVKTSNHPEGWIFLPKGTCEKIVGGNLSPKKG